MPNKIAESGIIGPDGRLRMPMDRLNAFFRENPCKRVVVQFEAAEPGSSALQQAYYYKYVVPTIQQALRETGERKSEKAVDRFLVEQYPGDKDESNIGLGVVVTEARHLNRSQMSDFLEWVKQFAAEPPLSIYVEDPQTL